MEKFELSIIIPVYNVENYLEKCLESVLKIKNINLEVILINDGSTDGSESICEKYKQKYANIVKYIKQKNQGLSESRNNGIRIANGEFVYFLDSDDFIEPDKFYEVFLKTKMFNPDITYFGYFYEGKDFCIPKYSYKSDSNKLYDSNDFLKNELRNRNLPSAACFGIYRRSLIIENNLFFQKGILHEDERWSPQILLKAKKILTSSNVVYHYIQRDNSIMHKKDKTKNGIDLVDTSNYLDKITDTINDKEVKLLLKNRQAMIYMRGTVIGRLYRIKYRKYISRFFPIKHATIFLDKLKAIIYFISPALYYLIAKIIKGD